MIACLCHDLDHRGTNNSFQIKSSSTLARLYSTSTMEHHHFDQCLMILNSKGNQILANLSQVGGTQKKRLRDSRLHVAENTQPFGENFSPIRRLDLTSPIFSSFSLYSQDEFKRVIFVLEDAILATDLAIYFRRRSETFAVIDDDALDWGSDAHRSLLRGMMMTGCDLSAITKPWPIQQKERYLMKSAPKGGVGGSPRGDT